MMEKLFLIFILLRDSIKTKLVCTKKIKTPIKPSEYFAQISGRFIIGIWLKTTSKIAIDLNIFKLFKLL